MESLQVNQEMNAPINIPNKLTFRGKQITGGKRRMPLKLIIYGDNGIGKTSFGTYAKNPIIMDLEGNCVHISTDKERLHTLEDCKEFLIALLSQSHDYKTLVIDSLDSLEAYFSESIVRRYSESKLVYGKKDVWSNEVKEFIEILESLSTKKTMNIIFTAHWKVKPANNPMTQQYDRYDLRINEAMRTGFCNWVQCILLAMKDISFEEKEAGFGKKKARKSVTNVLYTRGDSTYYAKNVFDLPEKIPFNKDKSWESFISYVNKFYQN